MTDKKVVKKVEKKVTKKKKEKEKPVKKRTIQQSLRVELTEKEKLAFSRDLAKANQDMAGEEVEKKEVMAQFAGRLSVLKTNIFNLSQKISNGYEYKSVDVDVYFNYKKSLKIFMRRDLKTIIAQETMTDSDRQQEFPFKEKEKRDAAKKKKADKEAKKKAADAKKGDTGKKEDKKAEKPEVEKPQVKHDGWGRPIKP